jgi:hypothetical protein
MRLLPNVDLPKLIPYFIEPDNTCCYEGIAALPQLNSPAFFCIGEPSVSHIKRTKAFKKGIPLKGRPCVPKHMLYQQRAITLFLL